MTDIQDLLDPAALAWEIIQGNVRQVRHPEFRDLSLLSYTEKVQYDNLWNETNRQCRGLIFNTRTGEALARPFDKFFNHGQAGAAQFDLNDRVIVTDKADGSLGILYRRPDGELAIATRGSFVSKQAQHATALLHSKYPHFAPFDGFTNLFEIIYPENRIVLDYGDQDDLVLLGARSIEHGTIYPPWSDRGRWRGPVVEGLGTMTFAEALALPPRRNAEGIVVRLLGYDDMVKIKQEDYIRLHKIVTGITPLRVWEVLASEDGQISSLLDVLPDEFHDWVREIAAPMVDAFEVAYGTAQDEWEQIVDHLTRMHGTQSWTNKDFALEVQRRGTDLFTAPGVLFSMRDGRDISPALWKSLRPKGDAPTTTTKED